MKRVSKKIIILSPPFYSHFQPLKTLGKALKSREAQVIIACSEEFRDQVLSAGLDFYPMEINKNRNTGIAKDTLQLAEEKKRLENFFEATYQGPVQTLVTQASHRIQDMFSNPQELIDSIHELDQKELPQLFIVDQLSYGATLALTGLGLPFITFCPPHPATIQQPGEKNGLIEFWPKVLEPDRRMKSELHTRLQEFGKEFSRAFSEVYRQQFPLGNLTETVWSNPFAMTSPKGILFNYPEYFHRRKSSDPPNRDCFYLHYCFEPEDLETSLKAKVLNNDSPKVLISFGTFLSERIDVIKKLISGFLNHQASWEIYVAAGQSVKALEEFTSHRVIKAGFLPQRALLPYMDLVVHHGGANSFTECLYYGKGMILFPFSSDQFAIAYDAEKSMVAQVLDPNHFTDEDLYHSVEQLRKKEAADSLHFWKTKVRSYGPGKGARWILEQLT